MIGIEFVIATLLTPFLKGIATKAGEELFNMFMGQSNKDIEIDTETVKVLQSWKVQPNNLDMEKKFTELIGKRINSDPNSAKKISQLVKQLIEDKTVKEDLIIKMGNNYYNEIRIQILDLGPIASPLKQLPYDIEFFTGRETELQKIMDYVERVNKGQGNAPAIFTIKGTRGVGKSALAIHAAYCLLKKGYFQDAQLYIDFSKEGEDLNRSDLMLSLLKSMNAPYTPDPNDKINQLGLYRSLMADKYKNSLLLLDNVRNVSEVRDLLPSSSKSTVLITSDSSLALSGRSLQLDIMTEKDSLDLLRQLAGRGFLADEDLNSAKKIVSSCERLPLALSIAGKTLEMRGYYSLVEYATDLANEKTRLKTLHLQDLSVRASFKLSFDELTKRAPDSSRLFCLLGILPKSGFTVDLAAELMNAERAAAKKALIELVDLNLLKPPEPPEYDRYRFYGLLWLFSQECIKESHEVLAAAKLRAVKWYLNSLKDILPTNIEWFYQERENLKTVVNWAYEAKEWKMATELMLKIPAEICTLWEEWEDVLKQALESEPNDEAKAEMLLRLGAYQIRHNKWKVARGALENSLELFKKLELNIGVGKSLMRLGDVYYNEYYWDDALIRFKEARKIFQELKELRLEDQTLSLMGMTLFDKGDRTQAIEMFEAALKISKESNDAYMLFKDLGNLGIIYRKQHNLNNALEIFKFALEKSKEFKDQLNEAESLINIGIIYLNRDKPDEAEKEFKQAAEIYQKIKNLKGESKAICNIGIVCSECSQWPQAKKKFEEALKISKDINDFNGMGHVLLHMGIMYRRQANYVNAMIAFEEALKNFQNIEVSMSEGQGETLRNMGIVLCQENKLDKAREKFDKALEIFSKLGDNHSIGKTQMNKGLLFLQMGKRKRSNECLEAALENLQKDCSEYKKAQELLKPDA